MSVRFISIELDDNLSTDWHYSICVDCNVYAACWKVWHVDHFVTRCGTCFKQFEDTLLLARRTAEQQALKIGTE